MIRSRCTEYVREHQRLCLYWRGGDGKETSKINKNNPGAQALLASLAAAHTPHSEDQGLATPPERTRRGRMN
jgi:hypothetical protein